MASKTLSTTALLLTLNILFFTMVSSTYTPCPPPPKKLVPKHPPHPKTPKTPCCNTPSPMPPSPKPPTTTPSPTPTTPSPTMPTCPRDTLKLGVCGNLLGGLLNIVIGTPSKTECCSLISGLADLDAAVCLCTAIKANILGINLNVPISLSLLLNTCGKKLPSGYQCE